MQRWILGLSSGCSGDGIDAALLQVNGVGLDLRVQKLISTHQQLPSELSEAIRRLDTESSMELKALARLHRLLGETYAAAARTLADGAGLGLPQVQVIGCAGHVAGADTEGRYRSMLSLGMPAVLAERTGVTVVSDFRTRDLAVGGHGTPLGALPDYLIFHHANEGRLLLHLGGIARLVYLPAGGKLREVIGFEAGPCSILLDALVRQLTAGRDAFDFGGKRAVQGKCIEPLVQSWLAHPALQRRPPRSLSRFEFGVEFARNALEQLHEHHGSLHDLLCTATHFVARSIGFAIRRYLPPSLQVDRVLLSGGGVRNGFLWQLLQQQVNAPMVRTDEIGIPAESRKSAAHGLLAALTVDGVPGNSPAATGAACSRLLGSLTPGSTSNWSRCLHWMAQQVHPLHAHALEG